MTYLYHGVPHDMRGTTIYPMNAMFGTDLHAVYEEQALKYIGRTHLLSERIALLDCLWNDVIFLTAVHPDDFRKAYASVGLERIRTFRFYEIDIGALDPEKLVVLTRMGLNRADEYERFNPERLADYARVPEATLDYWREQKARGKPPLLFMHIPHVLYQGAIDVSTARIVEA